MGSINIKHTGSGSDIALSSDGTSLLLDGTAIGGGGGDPDLYRDNASSAVTPTASGTNAVAIGSGTIAQGANDVVIGTNSDTGTLGDNVAIGNNARGQNLRSLAIGYNSRAANRDAISIGTDSFCHDNEAMALGHDAQAGGQQAVALTDSYASGADSFAAAIANNSSSYGATGANSVSIGRSSKATGSTSFAYGGWINATGTYAVGIGDSSTASGNYSYAIGSSNTASHTASVVIGKGASSSASDQITLGHTNQSVRVSSSYTLPSADGTPNQVLTTDGSGAVTFADAGGGADLYAANESSPSAQPSATGGNAVAIGEAPTASGNDSFAVQGGTASGNGALAIGRNVGGGNVSLSRANSTVAIMGSTTTNNHYSTAIGLNSSAHLATVGGSGMGAMALGGSYASGADSFAAAIANNTSNYGATGANSIAIGQLSKASDNGSIAIGKSCISDGGRTVALGHQTTASEFYSFAVGALSEALQTGSVCTGVRGRADVQGKRVHSSSTFSAQIGNCQTGELVLGKETTNATPAQLTSIPGNSASATNSITLPNNSCYGFTGTVIARENSSATNDFAVWEIKGGAVRAASASTIALGTYNINKISESTGATNWSIALSADTTNGAVAITVTGEASHSIRWVATVNTTEVIY